MKPIATCLALILVQLACSSPDVSDGEDEAGFVTAAQELRHSRHGDGRSHERRRPQETEVSYSYSFNGAAGSTRLPRGSSFTIWDEVGGCGVEFHDIAICERDERGRVRAFNHDCLAADGPGTFGPWVREGCSVAEAFGFTVECCIVPADHQSDAGPAHWQHR